MAVILQRTTADFPYQAGSEVEAPQAANPLDEVDAEPGIQRELTLPSARSFALDGWSSVSPAAPDTAIDALTGVPKGWQFSSSSRFQGTPIRRASSAFDGNAGTGWVGDAFRGRTPWISVRAPRPFTVSSFKLQSLPSDYAFPSLVRVTADGGFRRDLPVAEDGTVVLPRRVRTSFMRLDLLALNGPFTLGQPRAVGIGEISIPGLDPPHPRRQGSFTTSCGELSVGAAGGRATAAVSGTIAQLDAGAPLRLRGCGGNATLPLPSGTTLLSAPPGAVMRPDHLRLLSAAPAPLTGGAGSQARVVAVGGGTGGHWNNVRLSVPSPSWLVLAESYSRGWRAWCKTGQGARAEPGAAAPDRRLRQRLDGSRRLHFRQVPVRAPAACGRVLLDLRRRCCALALRCPGGLVDARACVPRPETAGSAHGAFADAVASRMDRAAPRSAPIPQPAASRALRRARGRGGGIRVRAPSRRRDSPRHVRAPDHRDQRAPAPRRSHPRDRGGRGGIPAVSLTRLRRLLLLLRAPLSWRSTGCRSAWYAHSPWLCS